jgi:hypothetical protein
VQKSVLRKTRATSGASRALRAGSSAGISRRISRRTAPFEPSRRESIPWIPARSSRFRDGSASLRHAHTSMVRPPASAPSSRAPPYRRRRRGRSAAARQSHSLFIGVAERLPRHGEAGCETECLPRARLDTRQPLAQILDALLRGMPSPSGMLPQTGLRATAIPSGVRANEQGKWKRSVAGSPDGASGCAALESEGAPLGVMNLSGCRSRIRPQHLQWMVLGWRIVESRSCPSFATRRRSVSAKA